MKRVVLGMSAAALVAAAALANDDKDKKVATAKVSVASFNELDTDRDGRLSAIEAANDTKVAAAFTRVDEDKDGYLSKTEYGNVTATGSNESTTERGK